MYWVVKNNIKTKQLFLAALLLIKLIPAWCDDYSQADKKISARDSQFILFEDEIVLDTKTGLMWASMDNGEPLDWYNAAKYCKRFRGGNYQDWRMPTEKELLTLFDASKNNPQGLHLTPLIKLTAKQIWSADSFSKSANAAKKPAAIYVRFDNDFSAGQGLVGFKAKKHEIKFHDTWANHRVLPVRDASIK